MATFDGNADRQNVAIVQDDKTKASFKAGRTGGLPYIGTGWFVLSLTPQALQQKRSFYLL